jgi:hypothetical protein
VLGVRRVAFVLGFLWALPTTLLGLLAGALTFQRPRLAGGLLVFDRAGARGLLRLLAALDRAAMTLGFVIVSSVPVQGALLAHERHHVRQAMWWGPLFVPVYLLLAAVFGYHRHPFERAARRAAGEEP